MKLSQSWTSLRSLHSSTENYRNVFSPDPDNPNLITIHTVPKLAIGQRAFLCLGDSSSGNVLWDCITYLDEDTIDRVNSLGGIQAIVISHPHYFSTSIQWAEVFNCDLFISAEDEQWLGNRGDGHRLKLWKGKKLPLLCPHGSLENHPASDLMAIKTGGHFPGSSVLWWKSAKKLLIADTILIVPSGLYHVDRLPGTSSFTFMWSYPNYVSHDPFQRFILSLSCYRFLFPRTRYMVYGTPSKTSTSRTPMGPSWDRKSEATARRGSSKARKLWLGLPVIFSIHC